jgi:hypothetical protein
LRHLTAAVLCFLLPVCALAESSAYIGATGTQMNGSTVPSEITNADVINMTKAGIGEQTIVAAIQHGPTKFDTSAQALIILKTGGVSDLVLNAVLGAVNNKDQTRTPQIVDAAALFQKALNAIGPHEKIAAVRSTRWKGVELRNAQGGTQSFERESIRVYPDSAYMTSRGSAGPLQTRVVTPDFSYSSSGNMTAAIPTTDLETIRDQLTFDTFNIAQHAEDFTITYAGEEQIGAVNAEKLKISKSGRAVTWLIDPQTGRLLSARLSEPSGDVETHFADWRLLSGIYSPFKRQMTGPGGSNDLTIAEYEINPPIDEKLFQRPARNISQGLSLKVMQSQSVPYTQESGGGVSTSCNIVGTANTSAYANTVGTNTYGNATTNSNQHMSCNSYDTTVRWPHVLNVMFADASDGNSYMFACDRAWRWSKCVPLQAGQIFSARFTDKGLEVEAFNTKGKQENPTYHVLQSRSSR